MARILITGSADGLGLMAGQLLAARGHAVTLHARNDGRAADALAALPEAEGVLVADVSTLAGMRAAAEQADATGAYGAVIHNVALGYREPRRVETPDGLSQLWAVNVLAPYVLAAAMRRPARTVVVSSGMHTLAGTSLEDLQWTGRRWNGSQAYAESKLHDVLLGFALARRWAGSPVNVVNPGWVPTVMGGPGAPDDLDLAHRTQAWLAASDDLGAQDSGRYLYHLEPAELHRSARDRDLQEELLQRCADISGLAVP